jgi:hypothetical protein
MHVSYAHYVYTRFYLQFQLVKSNSYTGERENSANGPRYIQSSKNITELLNHNLRDRNTASICF